MPYQNVPDDLVPKMDSCVLQLVQDKGMSKEAAIAMCYQSVVAAQPHRIEAKLAFDGREWEITIIGADADRRNVVDIGGQPYILSKNGLPYRVRGIVESVPYWDGIEVFDNHLSNQEFKERGGMRSPQREWVGNIVDPHWDASTMRLKGVFKVVDPGLGQKLKAAHDQGLLDRERVGFSIDTFPVYGRHVFEGRPVKTAEGFDPDRINSVDIVMRPAAGGGFDRLIAAIQPAEVNQMSEENRFEQFETRLAKVEAALANPGQQEQVDDPEQAASEVIDAAVDAADEAIASGESPADVAADVATAAAQAAAEIEDEEAGAMTPEMERVRKLECRLLLRDKLDAAKLNPQHRALVEQVFSGRIFGEKEVDGMIKRAKEAQAQGDPTGRVVGAGATPRISVGMNKDDVAFVEFLRLVAGNTKFRALEANENHYVQERMTESHKSWVKAGRPKYNTRRISNWVYEYLGGDPFSSERAYEAVTTSSMSSIVKNALNVLLANDYSVKEEWWDPIVTIEEVDTIDQATLVRVYGLDTLAVVDEGDPYLAMTWRDDEETASFVKKGNYVPVTLETLLNDKLNVVRSIPTRLANAWYNTLSALVSGVFTCNSAAGPVLTDTGALFNATAVTTAGGHANLLTAALAYTGYDASALAMMKQTDKYSGGESSIQGRRLMIEPGHLLIPIDLRGEAFEIQQSEHIPGSANFNPNQYRNSFEIIKVPDWTDSNNWALVGDKVQFPAIWLIFLNGRRVPELFSADSDTQGAMFTNDELRYKVRLMTWRFSSSYECAPVSDFRPLHKNNV